MTDAGALPDHIAALLVPGVIDPGGGTPRLVQTHISWVILAGDRACKLKKPRDFGFLDFTTVERRRVACETELALNRRLTHGVYQGVEAVTRDGSGYRLGGAGEVIDYAVLMRRLPADQPLRSMLRALDSRLGLWPAGAGAGPKLPSAAGMSANRS